MPDDALLDSLERAVAAAPEDVPLRLLLAGRLAAAHRCDDAVRHAAAALAHDPRNADALALVARGGRPDDATVLAGLEADLRSGARAEGGAGSAAPADGDVADPRSARPDPAPSGPRGMVDVAGMQAVKDRLERTFFGPLRNPDVAALYGVRAGGGVLLYGPPGCGKTYISRAVAAEMGVQFVAGTVADLYSPWLGEAEQNIQALYDEAARRAPCVVFLDEVDALGQRRSAMRGSGARSAVNQLLIAMDGAAEHGVLTVAATNHPWDVDPALRRPGRLDRAVLVEPPDEEARAEVLRVHLRGRPALDVDLAAVAARTPGFSAADLAQVCLAAVQAALAEALRTGDAAPVTTDDLLAAAADITPSTAAWFDTARTVVRFSGRSGEWDDLRAYMRREKLL